MFAFCLLPFHDQWLSHKIWVLQNNLALINLSRNEKRNVMKFQVLSGKVKLEHSSNLKAPRNPGSWNNVLTSRAPVSQDISIKRELPTLISTERLEEKWFRNRYKCSNISLQVAKIDKRLLMRQHDTQKLHVSHKNPLPVLWSAIMRSLHTSVLRPLHLGGRELPFCFVCSRVFFFFVLRSF